VATINRPPEYRLEGLLRSLEDPSGHRHGFEARLGETLASYGLGIEDGGAPNWQYSRSIPLPSKALCRALDAGTTAAAGDLTVAGIQRVAEAVRPVDALVAAGVPRLEVTATAAVSFPSWEAESVAGSWKAENADGYTPAIEVRSVDATARQALAYIEISRRLRLQVPDLEAALLAELERSVRGVLEVGFLSGDNTEGKPMGLLNVPGAQAQAFGAAVPTRDELVSMLEKFTAAHGNLSRAVWVMTSAMAAGLLRSEVVGGTGQFILSVAPNGLPTVCGIPSVISDYMPTGKLLLFDPSTCREVFWGPAYSLLDRFSNDRDRSGSELLLVHQLADVVSLAPSMLVVGTAA